MKPDSVITALRTSRRAQLTAGGAAAGLVVVVLVLASLGKPSPGPGPGDSGTAGASPGATQQLLAYTLPRPSTTDVALIVAEPAALTQREQAWLADLRAQFGLVDPIAAKAATFDMLTRYLTIFVVDDDADLDVAALRSAFAAGLTVNLAGAATAYRGAILASPAP